MKNKIKAVIFDQDGLMFDTERVSAEAWGKAGEEIGFQLEESFLCTIRGMNFKDAVRRFEDVFGVGPDYAALRARKQEIFEEILKERGVPVKAGLKELLIYLKDNGYKTAVATASKKEYTLRNLREVGIESYFDSMSSGDMVTNSKPDPELFLTVAEMLGESPENCMVLEDSLNGVEAGLRGGFFTVMIPDLTKPDQTLRERVDWVCESLCEVKNRMERENL